VPHIRPTGQSRPGLSPAHRAPRPRSSFRPIMASPAQAHAAPRLPLPRADTPDRAQAFGAAWWPHAGDAGRMAPSGPSHVRTRPSSSRPQCPAYLTPPFSSPPHSSNSRATDERSGHASPPLATTSSLRLRLAIAQHVLAPACRGKASSDGHCSPKLSAPRRRGLLRGPRSFAPPLAPISCAFEPFRSPGAQTPLPAPHRGRRPAPAGEPRH
jgi:hypothetical protein